MLQGGAQARFGSQGSDWALLNPIRCLVAMCQDPWAGQQAPWAVDTERWPWRRDPPPTFTPHLPDLENTSS